MKRIIISGGGTGGHIYPAIAIANQLKNTLDNPEILFVGANNRMEMQKVPQAGYKIIGLDIAGIQRSLSLTNTKANILFPFKLFKSLAAARKIIKEFKPDIAVGVGGYASGPLLFAAARMNVPTLIQEQNSYAGLTNKWLSKSAKKICVAYPAMDNFFPKDKLIFTGNPVRSDILDIFSKRKQAQAHFGLDKNKKTILVIGGSLGARTINESIELGLNRLTENNIQVIWQTGKTYYEKAVKATENHPNIKVFEFINVMDLAYAAADIVLSRAGALSISELCLVAKPAILIPSPNVSENHQTKNAMALVNNNAALLVADVYAKDFLIGDAIDLLSDSVLQGKLSQNIVKLAKPNAAQEIVTQILKIIDK